MISVQWSNSNELPSSFDNEVQSDNALDWGTVSFESDGIGEITVPAAQPPGIVELTVSDSSTLETVCTLEFCSVSHRSTASIELTIEE